MATLARDLVNDTRGHLLAAGRQDLNKLAEDLDTSEVGVDVTYALGNLQARSVISVDLELMYVWSVSSLTATVQRGYLGTTAAIHNNGAIVEVNPRFSDYHIFRALNDELASFSSPVNGLYRIRTVDVTYAAARSGYNLTGVTDIIDILNVEAKGHLAGDRHAIRRWRLIRDTDTADFASGLALVLHEGPIPGKVVEVAYKAPYVALGALADDVQTVSFLPATANDIPPLGAAARLLAGRESRRAQFDSQPEPRQAADVPPGANRNAVAALLALRNQRLEEESARLHAAYPTLSRSA